MRIGKIQSLGWSNVFPYKVGRKKIWSPRIRIHSWSSHVCYYSRLIPPVTCFFFLYLNFVQLMKFMLLFIKLIVKLLFLWRSRARCSMEAIGKVFYTFRLDNAKFWADGQLCEQWQHWDIVLQRSCIVLRRTVPVRDELSSENIFLIGEEIGDTVSSLVTIGRDVNSSLDDQAHGQMYVQILE